MMGDVGRGYRSAVHGIATLIHTLRAVGLSMTVVGLDELTSDCN